MSLIHGMSITDQAAAGNVGAEQRLRYSQGPVHFRWAGFDEMGEVSGDGHAELLDDGVIEIVLACYNGEEAVLKAEKRLP
ncbi:hypothetical protein [Neorhizobium sp. DAR64861/K0K2]|uniref:hypothetical protein n=1 Tax=unclassified Neorhizobium TaxID=2629175 RepID=UPI003D2D2694